MQRIEIAGVGEEFEGFVAEFEITLRSRGGIGNYGLALRLLGEYLAARGIPLDPTAVTREHLESFVADLRIRGRKDNGRAFSSASVANAYSPSHTNKGGS